MGNAAASTTVENPETAAANPPKEVSSVNLPYPPPPPIEGETAAAKRFRETLPGFFLRLKQPEIPGIWGSWDPSQGPQRTSGSNWPRVDTTQAGSGEGLMSESSNVQKLAVDETSNTMSSAWNQTQDVPANVSEPPKNIDSTARSTATDDATALVDSTKTLSHDSTTSTLEKFDSEIPHKHSSRMWDVAAPGSNTLTFDDTADYASVLASVSDGQGDNDQQNGNKNASSSSRGEDKDHTGGPLQSLSGEARERRESVETRSRPGWFSQGSIWSF